MIWRLSFLSAAAVALHAATYYVDSAKGSDANAGTFVSAPWRTLAKVNATEFQPSDHILFKSGAVWEGQLVPKSSGAGGAPIVVDRYGSGPKPRIDGAGQVEDALKLYNVQHIEVRNLEITNHGAEAATRRGHFSGQLRHGEAHRGVRVVCSRR